ncbi:DUF1330 domain-containing protein [Asticcacaulis sp. 201]|uniref:DUF1330 domain-containing protein n=1 Tax=Asticcacaulis sp. 201 TaxID=3028787 RepID=UPI002916D98F|nr:DUF1330 domain-containing protein [Asticcacaulis sp. 201]MDV6329713.1 DUF1330 domain-containing protein [Asticcacaulis sp. 201]
MTAYVIMIRDRMIDPAEMAIYAELARKARGDTPPRQLAFYGPHETLEGEDADGIVILEFDDMDAARRWHGSPAYQAAMQHRHRAADYRVLLVDGVKPA